MKTNLENANPLIAEDSTIYSDRGKSTMLVMRPKLAAVCIGITSSLIVSFSTPSGFSAPTNDQWQRLIQEGGSAEAGRDTVTAESLFSRALTIADRHDPACKQLGHSLCRILRTEILNGQAKDPQSQQHYRELLQLLIDEHKHGKKLDPEVDVSSLDVEETYLSSKDPRTREVCLIHAAAMCQCLYDKRSSEKYFAAMMQLAQYYNEHRRYEEAIGVLDALEHMKNKTYGANADGLQLVTLTMIAQNCQSAHRFDTAKLATHRCISFASKSAQFKDKVPTYYAQLGSIAIDEGNMTESKKNYDLAMAQTVKLSGANSKPAAMITFFRAQRLYNNAHYAEAESDFKRAIAILEKLPRDPNDQTLANVWDQLILVYNATHQSTKADQCRKKAQQVRALIHQH